MKLNDKAIVWIPDGTEESAALARTTHLTLASHQDDIEYNTYPGIAECFGRRDKWFCGVVTTDGAGSPRNGLYADYSDEEMKAVRIVEQKKAAFVGEYGAQILLGHSSAQTKDPDDVEIVEEFVEILRATKPRYVYLQNLADKHDTHVATAIKAIAALRRLPEDERPERVLGCEAWRSLDWMCDAEKVLLNCDSRPNLARSLEGLFDSQIAGGKNYDVAAEGRRIANATYLESHACDTATRLGYAMDLTPLVADCTLDPVEYVLGYVRRFEADVRDRLCRALGRA